MKIQFDFEDTDGKWTDDKRTRATETITERCRAKGYTKEPAIVFPDPVGLPASSGGSIVFHYCPYAEIPDT